MESAASAMNGVRIFGSLIVAKLVPAQAWAHGISEDQKQRMIEGGYQQYIILGAEHMLTGYDHLLFLLGVLFFLTTFKDITKFITAFTLGHCITLLGATFFQITWDYFFIDAMIALSIVYKAFDNNRGFQEHLGLKSPNLLTMVFLFGLIHGFGLSTRLQQLPMGEDKVDMLYRILSFNVGVELGQIFALVIMVMALSGWRRKDSFKRFSYVANIGLLFAGLYLFFMQMHGFWHNRSPDEFGFPIDEHRHIHEDMELQKLQEESGRENLE